MLSSCSILADEDTGRHGFREMSQPGMDPLTQRIMQQVTGAISLLRSEVCCTRTHTNTHTHIGIKDATKTQPHANMHGGRSNVKDTAKGETVL